MQSTDFIHLFENAFLKEPKQFSKSEVLETLQHPNFPRASTRARTLYLEEMAKGVGRLDMSQLTTITLHVLIIYYHCHRKFAQEERRKALSDVKEFVEKNEIASSRHVSNIVTRLVDLGRVIRAKSPFDSRIQWLVPTPAMIEVCMSFLMCAIEALTDLGLPQHSLDRLKSDQELQEVFLYMMSRSWMASTEMLLLFKSVRAMAAKQRGMALVASIALDTTRIHGTVFAEKPVPFTVSGLAGINRVSRSHIRLLLEYLRQSNYIKVDYSKHEVTVMRKLAMELECCMASSFICHRNALNLALNSPFSAMAR